MALHTYMYTGHYKWPTPVMVLCVDTVLILIVRMHGTWLCNQQCTSLSVWISLQRRHSNMEDNYYKLEVNWMPGMMLWRRCVGQWKNSGLVISDKLLWALLCHVWLSLYLSLQVANARLEATLVSYESDRNQLQAAQLQRLQAVAERDEYRKRTLALQQRLLDKEEVSSVYRL